MNNLIEQVKTKILDYSGIYVAPVQLPALSAHIEKRAAQLEISVEEFVKLLVPHTPDFDEIINLVTVNETYFFREQAQFDFLKEQVFPKYMGKELTIWSCCCSTGEEVISLLALAVSMNVNLTIYASDIDDHALQIFKEGHFSLYSLRGDGQKYHKLLEPYSTRTEKEIIIRKEFLNRINIFKFNLIGDNLSQLPFFGNVDIIFMRNVFIYFDKETRKNITDRISLRIKDNGLLFFSMNEIGSMDDSMMPRNMSKTNCGMVYYFTKNTYSELNQTGTPVEVSRRKIEKNKEKENLERVVQKNKVQKHAALSKCSASEENSVLSEKSCVDAKRIYENVCQEINSGNFENARKLAREISGADSKMYSFFIQGYIEYHAENIMSAENLFASAETVCDDFWPAFFYHGMVLRDLGKHSKAKDCFSKCSKIISKFGTEIPYDFTLDSFSPSYISSLCKTFSIEGEQ